MVQNHSVTGAFLVAAVVSRRATSHLDDFLADVPEETLKLMPAA